MTHLLARLISFPALLLAGFVLLSVNIKIQGSSSWGYYLIQPLSQVGLIERPLFVLMQLGAISFAVMLAVILAVQKKPKQSSVLALAAISSWLLAHLAKALVALPRPEVNQLGSDGFGYPSSHAAVAAALAYCLTAGAKSEWKAIAALAVVLVGAARVYFGAHFPLDVVGGALLGLGVAAAIRAVLQDSRVEDKGDTSYNHK